MADLTQQIETTAQAPASVSAGGTAVTEPNLQDLVEADRYLAQKEAAAKKHRGLRITKLVPPGSV